MEKAEQALCSIPEGVSDCCSFSWVVVRDDVSRRHAVLSNAHVQKALYGLRRGCAHDCVADRSPSPVPVPCNQREKLITQFVRSVSRVKTEEVCTMQLQLKPK